MDKQTVQFAVVTKNHEVVQVGCHLPQMGRW